MKTKRKTMKRRTTRRTHRRIGMPQTPPIMVAGTRRNRRMGAPKKDNGKLVMQVAGVIAGGAVAAMLLPTLPGNATIKNVAGIAAGLAITHIGKKPLVQGMGIGFAAASGTALLKNSGIISGVDSMVAGVISPVTPLNELTTIPAAVPTSIGDYGPVGYNYPSFNLPDAGTSYAGL